MSTSSHKTVVLYGTVVALLSVVLIMAGCAVDHLRMSMDRGAISPKVEPSWLDHRDSPTNAP